MITFNRLLACLIALTIIATTMLFAYGLSTDTLSSYLSFDLAALLAKSALAVAMLVVAFFPRPRAAIHRFMLGVIATGAIGVATFEALSTALMTGDALILTFGALIAAFESVEATLPKHRKALPTF